MNRLSHLFLHSCIFALCIVQPPSLCSAQEPAGEKPTPPPTVRSGAVELGSIAAGSVTNHKVRFRNPFDDSFAISSITRSCGCTKIGTSAELIEKGGELELDVELSASTQPGPFATSVKIDGSLGKGNEKSPAVIQLKLQAVFHAKLEVHPNLQTWVIDSTKTDQAKFKFYVVNYFEENEESPDVKFLNSTPVISVKRIGKIPEYLPDAKSVYEVEIGCPPELNKDRYLFRLLYSVSQGTSKTDGSVWLDKRSLFTIRNKDVVVGSDSSSVTYLDVYLSDTPTPVAAEEVRILSAEGDELQIETVVKHARWWRIAIHGSAEWAKQRGHTVTFVHLPSSSKIELNVR